MQLEQVTKIDQIHKGDALLISDGQKVIRRYKEKIKPGTIFAGWLLLVAVGRALIEVFRPDKPKIANLGISYSALFAVLMAIAGGIMLLARYKIIRLKLAENWEEEYQVEETPHVEEEPVAEKAGTPAKSGSLIQKKAKEKIAARKAKEFVHYASELPRVPVTWDEIWVSTKCGESDTTSGLGSNPTVGRVFERLEKNGNFLIFGETTEVTGQAFVFGEQFPPVRRVFYIQPGQPEPALARFQVWSFRQIVPGSDDHFRSGPVG